MKCSYKRQKYIASVSFGKDSLAMLLMLIDKGYPLDEVIFYDTGMEFKCIYNIRDRIKLLLDNLCIKYTELYPEYDFMWKMFDKPVNGRKNGFHLGYSWCGGRCRWGTTDKLNALDKYTEYQNALVYIGIAADEQTRIAKDRKSYKRLPLVDWGISESDALQYCYNNGFYLEENNIRLYDILDRVSCWCCSNKNLKELKNVYHYLPDYWEMLRDLQSRTARPMKGKRKSVFDLEDRFLKEFEVKE